MGSYGEEWQEIIEWTHFVTIALLIMYCHYKLTDAARRTRDEIILGQENYKTYCQCGSTSI